jgi:hypothetical protein
MSKRSRNTGSREERNLAKLLGATKISRTGYTGPDLNWNGHDVEVKYRGDGNGFKLLYRWLHDVQVLAVRSKRQPWLLVLEANTLLDMLDAAAQDDDTPPTFSSTIVK